MEKIKQCAKCKQIKLINNFNKDKSKKDLLYSSCKECTKKVKKKQYENNKANILKKQRKYYSKHKIKIRKRVKIYARKHKKENSLRHKKWRIKNKTHIKEYNKKWHKEQSIKNIKYRINRSLRNKISGKIKGKNKRTIDCLPYTINELIRHLENQFEPWMNWDNYGRGKNTWQIDHIIPTSHFNYKSVKNKEFQKCWALKNLRPLDWKKNIKKSNKII